MTAMIDNEETRSVYSPTLLIGLGGTGSEILLSVREKVLRNKQDILNKFLFVDTDIKTTSAKKGYSDLNNNEICMVGMRSAGAYLHSPRNYKGITERFPTDQLTPQYVSLLSQGTGAAQIRSLGALAFALDYNNIRKKIESTIDELTKAQNRQEAKALKRGITIKKQSIIVYIVGSIVGGTGSGTFVDTAVVARDVIDYSIGWDTTVIGMFTLPDGYDSVVRNDKVQRENIRANAYASLKELQYLSDREYDRLNFDYEGGMKVTTDRTKKVYDNVYLIDNRNTSGSIGLDNIYELAASSIYQDIGTPFGANSQAAQINMGIFNGLAPDPKSGKTRMFSSLAASALVYPAERVADYCTASCLSEVVTDQLLGPSESLQKVKNEVDSFLQGNNLEERAPANQIIDSLLEAESGVISSRTRGLDPVQWEKENDVREFIDEVESETNYVDNVIRKDVVQIVEDNKIKLLHGSKGEKHDRLREIVQDWVINLASNYNVNTAVKALETLVNTSKIMSEELKSEKAAWERRRQTLSEDIDQYVSDLGDIGFFGRQRGKHRPIISKAVIRYNELVDEKLENWAKSGAIEIVDHLSSVSSELRSRWSNLVQMLETVMQEATDEALHQETSTTRKASSRFATEIEVTDPGYEKEYFKENYKSPEKVYSGIVEAHGVESGGNSSRRDFIEWLFRSSKLSNGIDVIAVHMRELIENRYWKHLYETNIIDFIKENQRDPGSFLDDKLQMLFELCSPFWQLGPQMLAHIEMPETFCVSVKHVVDDDGDMNPPQEIKDWITKYSLGGAKGQLLDNDVPYSIAVNKRVHGARAYFLSATPRWEKVYKTKRRQAKNKFMLHVHSDFSGIPELAPSDDEAILAFAKGMALGFIVKRGDWYYYGLEEKYDVASGSNNLEVGYRGHWQTFRDLPDVEDVPEKCGRIWFKLENVNPDNDMKLANGRENAVRELERKEEWVKQINEAFSEYYRNVGMDLRMQLASYLSNVLEPASKKATGSNKELLEKEIAALTDWAKNA